jgi:hypothetical protein
LRDFSKFFLSAILKRKALAPYSENANRMYWRPTWPDALSAGLMLSYPEHMNQNGRAMATIMSEWIRARHYCWGRPQGESPKKADSYQRKQNLILDYLLSRVAHARQSPNQAAVGIDLLFKRPRRTRTKHLVKVMRLLYRSPQISIPPSPSQLSARQTVNVCLSCKKHGQVRGPIVDLNSIPSTSWVARTV